MTNRHPATNTFLWSTVGLAAAMLLGCGGGSDEPATAAAPPPAPAPAPTPSPAPAPAPAPAPTPAPAPAPAPPPSAQVLRGKALYDPTCANCHGSEPADMISNIQRGTTAAALAASYRSVRDMAAYQTSLTPANNEDIAAFIRSRLSP